MSLASERIGFIFVRVPRTGSTTYSDRLRECFGPDLFEKGAKHSSAVELRELWGPKWGEWFTFGCIRNPWEWLVSFYNSGVSVSVGQKERWPGVNLTPLNQNAPVMRSNVEFDAWVRDRRATPIDWLSDETGVIVDRVYRFEDRVRGSDIHRSAMKHAPYREWYTPELAGYVAEKCKREIEIGEYRF